MPVLTAFVAGLMFGLGLILSGMSDPAKVLGFLDLAGAWDPSLALVMAGAVAVGLVAFRLFRDRSRSLLGMPLQMPTARRIDRRLLAGSALFGIGWGLAGICPGPALVLLGAGSPPGMLFTAGLLGGMAAFEAHRRLRETPRP